jgi:RNA polymerase sigma factor (sigma-70 family)
MQSENEYRIDIKVRNNLILTKIESLGYKSVHDFCNASGISYPTLLNFTNMKNPIFDTKGRIKKSIQKLCDLLNCIPEEIFSASQMEASLKSNKRTLQVKEAEMMFLMDQSNNQNILEDLTERQQMEDLTEEALGTLTQREEKIIQMRFGLGEYKKEHNLNEISGEFNLSSDRIRQIEQKALRKLRHHVRSEKLRHFIHPDEVLTEKEKEINKLKEQKKQITWELSRIDSRDRHKVLFTQESLKQINIKINQIEKGK